MCRYFSTSSSFVSLPLIGNFCDCLEHLIKDLAVNESALSHELECSILSALLGAIKHEISAIQPPFLRLLRFLLRKRTLLGFTSDASYQQFGKRSSVEALYIDLQWMLYWKRYLQKLTVDC